MLFLSGQKKASRRQQCTLALVYFGIAILGFSSWYILDRAYSDSAREAQKKSLQQVAEMAGVRANARLDAYGVMVQSLSSLMAFDGVEDKDHFDGISRIVVEYNPSIVNIALSRNYIVTEVFPFEPNKKVLGYDFRERPEFKDSIDLAMVSANSVVSGPYDLIQGGQGLIYRAAPKPGVNEIYSVVVRLDAFLAEIGIDVNDSETLSAVRKFDSETGTVEHVFGDPIVWNLLPVTAEISVGDTSLEYGLAPRKGWKIPPKNRNIIAAVVLMLTAVSMFGVNYARRLIVERSAARQQLVTAIEAIEDGFIIFDEDDRLLMCNEKYRSYYQASSDLIVPGALFEDIIRGGVQRGQFPEADGREGEWIAERLAWHDNPRETLEQQLGDGRWLKVVESKTRSGATVGIHAEVTQLKNALFDAESANRSKSDFLDNISHEFRTPLSIILGYLSFIRNIPMLPSHKLLNSEILNNHKATLAFAELSGEIEKFALKAERSGKHLMNLINTVLDWSTLSESRIELNLEEMNLGELLTSLTDDLQETARKKGIELRVSVHNIWVVGDVLRLRQVFLNLLSNALKFTEVGYVEVTAKEVANDVHVIVRDTGPGIPPEQKGFIFERFTQIDTSTKRRYSGTGLGLAISKSFVDLHGGKIQVSSAHGQGCTFTVILPKKLSEKRRNDQEQLVLQKN